MSISARRKSVFENRPTKSKIRQTQRRPVKTAALRVRPLRVNAAELARRKFLHLAAGAAMLPAISRSAEAQAYPTRPVRLIVGFAPGGLTDMGARIMGQWLSEQLRQPVIIENMPGGTGNIAARAAINSPADGYTLLLAGASNAINASFYDGLPFNFVRDIAPVAGLVSWPLGGPRSLIGAARRFGPAFHAQDIDRQAT